MINRAFLTFANKGVAALKVFYLLVSNGVQYVVINVCKSARSDHRLRGNLAKTLIKNSIIAILAISYKLSISTIFFFTCQFYQAFLQESLPFARAIYKAYYTIQK